MRIRAGPYLKCYFGGGDEETSFARALSPVVAVQGRSTCLLQHAWVTARPDSATDCTPQKKILGKLYGGAEPSADETGEIIVAGPDPSIPGVAPRRVASCAAQYPRVKAPAQCALVTVTDYTWDRRYGPAPGTSPIRINYIVNEVSPRRGLFHWWEAKGKQY
ncbi:hypothetical protein J6590_014993 [Homalodisca vitripennis]|nr:hypothetical protein J6590_014993 [Homalodisca vitripennis]